jgi:hypothetical protein
MIVKQAEYIEGYKIKIIFSNGEMKVVDFAQFLKKAKHVFLPLKNVDYFRKFQVDGITLSWPNGADFDPELLYSMGTVAKGRSIKSAARKPPLKPLVRKKRTVKTITKK